MTIFANRQARTATVASVALAAAIFAAPSVTLAHPETTVSPNGQQSVAEVQSDKASEKTEMTRKLTAREKGFGRRGGTK